ncbi:MAG: hypothetical protein IPK52_19725 [Chloroflexi bacterium]|nr:hypothetical protein [Chloroflexota bacterium]
MTNNNGGIIRRVLYIVFSAVLYATRLPPVVWMLTPVIPSPAEWDAFVRSREAAGVRLLQLAVWAEHKTHFGWRYIRWPRKTARNWSPGRVLIRPLPGKLFTMVASPARRRYVSAPEQWPALIAAVEHAPSSQFRAAFIGGEPYKDGLIPDPGRRFRAKLLQTVLTAAAHEYAGRLRATTRRSGANSQGTRRKKQLPESEPGLRLWRHRALNSGASAT